MFIINYFSARPSEKALPTTSPSATYVFADEFRVCFSIHNEPTNKNAHIVVCTSNIINPDNPLTANLLNKKYYPLIKKVAETYNYELHFIKDDDQYEYNKPY